MCVPSIATTHRLLTVCYLATRQLASQKAYHVYRFVYSHIGHAHMAHAGELAIHIAIATVASTTMQERLSV